MSRLRFIGTASNWTIADYDGVMDYSGQGARLAPMIEPGQTFEARMTPPRAGTFIYHTHFDDIWQLSGGLAAPLIVLEPGQTYDPSSDHAFTIMTSHTDEDNLLLINGVSKPAAVTIRAGVLQRLRLINMTTAWTNAIVSLSQRGYPLQWNALAVDGAYVAPARRTAQSAVSYVTIGQTRDFTFTPRTTGDLVLQFWPDPTVPNIVSVPIHVVR